MKTKQELIQKLKDLVTRWEKISEKQRWERFGDSTSINNITYELDIIIEECDE